MTARVRSTAANVACLLALSILIGPFCAAAAATEIILAGGLRAPAQIPVDRWGVPHICAASEANVYFMHRK
jgi:penicillin amidase